MGQLVDQVKKVILKIWTTIEIIVSYNDDPNLTRNLVNRAWGELQEYGFRHYASAFSNQLERCSPIHKSLLRLMILDRMRSFVAFATQMKKRRNSGMEETESLKNQIETLQKENSRHQAALGNITNVSWNDNDQDNTTKLISDIEELQDMLTDFTMVQGSDYKINDENATKILRKHGCLVEYPSTKANLVLGSILQRCTIQAIFEEATIHLKGPESVGPNDGSLESDIVRTADSLIEYTELFRQKRKGDDDITKIAPIKIRQHTYSALGCRGFSNDDHPLIQTIVDKLLNQLNRFRHVVDEETNDELRDLAPKIIRGVVNLFFFRLKAQASELRYKFFKAGEDIDVRFMQGSFGREEAKKLEVEACGFPCIGVLDGDESSRKVFTRAQIIARPRKK